MGDDLPPERQDHQSDDQESDDQVDLGILFVHGIGRQQRGDALLAPAEALYYWFLDWFRGRQDIFTEPYNVSLNDTLLATSEYEPAAPAHCRIKLSQGRGANTVEAELLLAESHWAESFPVPSYREVAAWAFSALPWALVSQLCIALTSILFKDSRTLRQYPRIILGMLGYVVAIVLAIAIQLAVIAVLVVALIPIRWIREPLLRLQMFFASVVGDSYVFLDRPVHSSAIVTQVRRDLEWLAGKACKKIAIIAHSQGAAVAHEAISSKGGLTPGVCERLELFFTYGAGIGKLHDVRKVLASAGWLRRLLLALITLALLGVGFGLYELVQSVPGTIATDRGAAWDSFVLFSFAPIAVSAIAVAVSYWLILGRQEEFETNIRWIDRYATADLVPAGAIVPPLLDEDQTSYGPSDSRAVCNSGSYITDHVTYWQNRDEFVTDVIMAIDDVLEGKLHSALSNDLEHMTGSKALQQRHKLVRPRRRWRASWLAWARASVVFGFVLFTMLNPSRLSLAGKKAVSAYRNQPLDIVPEELTAAIESIPGNWLDNAVGFALAAVAYFLVYQLTLAAWRGWDGRDTRRFFEQWPHDAGSTPFFIFVALGVAAPTSIAILFAYMDTFALVSTWNALSANSPVLLGVVPGWLFCMFFFGVFIPNRRREERFLDGEGMSFYPLPRFLILGALTLPAILWAAAWRPDSFRMDTDGNLPLSGSLGIFGLFAVAALVTWIIEWLGEIISDIFTTLSLKEAERPPPSPTWQLALFAVFAAGLATYLGAVGAAAPLLAGIGRYLLLLLAVMAGWHATERLPWNIRIYLIAGLFFSGSLTEWYFRF